MNRSIEEEQLPGLKPSNTALPSERFDVKPKKVCRHAQISLDAMVNMHNTLVVVYL